MPINAPCVITSIENLSKSAAKNKKKREAQKRSKQLGAGKDEPQGLGKSTSEELRTGISYSRLPSTWRDL